MGSGASPDGAGGGTASLALSSPRPAPDPGLRGANPGAGGRTPQSGSGEGQGMSGRKAREGAPRPGPPAAAGAPIPVTVLGGFLGAGKTTLVNRLLAAGGGGPGLAVLVNDFGELAVDETLIAERGAETLTLTSGCICCSMSDGLTSALVTLIERAEKARDGGEGQGGDRGWAPERILIEASGVADPARVAALARLDPALTLDAVFTVVDAERVESQLEDRYVADTVRRQLEGADLLLLGKLDRLKDPSHPMAVLARQAPGVPVVALPPPGETSEEQGRRLALLLDPGARREGTPPPGWEATPKSVRGAPEAGIPEGDPPGEARFWRLTVPFPEPVPEASLREGLRNLPPNVLRVKGFVAVRYPDGSAGRVLVQGVGRRFELAPGPDTPAPGLVLIGTGSPPEPDRLPLPPPPPDRRSPGSGSP